MNVLITNSKSGAFFEIANGWRNALISSGHKVELWDNDDRVWDVMKPDLFIGCSGWKKNFQHLIKKYNTKLAIHVNPFTNGQIRAQDGPTINETSLNIAWVVSNRPDAVFGYALQDDMDKYWYLWKDKYGFKLIGMANAADVVRYKPIQPSPEFECDVGWVGGYWPYKSKNIDKYLIPVIRKFKSMWYGWSGPPGLYKGKINGEGVLKIFNSAKICPTVVEPHTTQYGIDVPERIFKVSACGAMVISDPFYGSDKYYSNAIIAKDPQDYFELCRKYIEASWAERRERARRMMEETLDRHTYYHRLSNLLSVFGFIKESEGLINVAKQIKIQRLSEFDALRR